MLSAVLDIQPNDNYNVYSTRMQAMMAFRFQDEFRTSSKFVEEMVSVSNGDELSYLAFLP